MVVNSNITGALCRETTSGPSSIHTVSLTMHEHYVSADVFSELDSRLSDSVNEWRSAPEQTLSVEWTGRTNSQGRRFRCLTTELWVQNKLRSH
jgi:hypothetical protein